MKNEGKGRGKAYDLYLKKIKARAKVESIERKMVSSAEGGRIILAPLEELKRLVGELRQADEEYQAAVDDFLNYLSGGVPR